MLCCLQLLLLLSLPQTMAMSASLLLRTAGQLPRDLEIRWNARLLTTAGLTHYKREIPDDPYAPPM